MRSGGITTRITRNNAEIDDATKKMIDTQVDEMRKTALDLVKHDFNPTPDTPASTSRGFFSSVFGGASVSMKANFQRRGVHL